MRRESKSCGGPMEVAGDCGAGSWCVRKVVSLSVRVAKRRSVAVVRVNSGMSSSMVSAVSSLAVARIVSRAASSLSARVARMRERSWGLERSVAARACRRAASWSSVMMVGAVCIVIC